MAVTALTKAIADYVGVDVDRVATGTGSVGVLGQILQATCADGDEVVYAWRSFEAYPIVVGISGARGVQVPLTADARHDLPAMADAITDRTRLVLLCTPNNPTGPVVHRERAGDVPRPGAERRARGDRRGVPRVRPRPAVARRDRGAPRAAECRCAADVLEGVRTGRPARRLRRGAPPGGGRAAQDGRALRRLGHRPGRRRRLAGGRGRAVRAGRGAGRRAHPGARRAAPPGLERARHRGQLRVAAARRRGARVRRASAPPWGSACARSTATACAAPSARPRPTTGLLEVCANDAGTSRADSRARAPHRKPASTRRTEDPPQRDTVSTM